MRAAAIGVLVALCVGFLGGWLVHGWRVDAAQLVRDRQASREAFNRQEKADGAAVGHEQFKAKEEIRYVTRTKLVDRLVDRPVYRNVCLDADGLQLINDAIAGREAAGEPAPAVPRPAGDP